MAEASGRIDSTGSGVSKNRRNFTSGSATRIKSRLTRSPKRRAGTPEPEQKNYTDDSEKDVSDGEYLPQSEGSMQGVGNDSKGKSNSAIRRFFSRKDKRDAFRSKSLEPNSKEPESEDDFEMILQMHKSKEKEEEKKEEEKLLEDSKPKPKEELKEPVAKEMPPLIVAPKDTKKRKRHKSLPLQESQSEEEKPKTPLAKTKMKLLRRKPSTSEEEDFSGSRRGSAKSEDEKSDLRNRRLVSKRLEKENIKGGTLGGEVREKSEDEMSQLRNRRLVSKRLEMGNMDGGTLGGEGLEEKKLEEEKKKEELVVEKKSWFSMGWFTKSKKGQEEKKPEMVEKEVEKKVEKKAEGDVKKGWFIAYAFREWRAHINEHRNYYNRCMLLKNRCITDLLILLLICGCGGFVFRFTEGAFESFYKCGVKRVKRDFIDTLWKNSQYMLEEDWKSQARRKLMEFENQLHSAHEAGMTTYSGQKSWSFLNAVVYCLTVVTTIGYGHISPSTTTGRAITIIYAVFGIPMFLILLADFGKLFTRGIKFLWAFVRRLYYTGSCRKVRKTAPVQEVMKGMQIMYDFAKSRRLTSAGLEPHEGQQHHLRPPEANIPGHPETPSTPNWSAYEIDDEFNLPISVAFTILLIYIFLGAIMYWIWEEWSFFESFYFVFISMSTIGFGDFVPQHPMYMMLSIVYLIFGLALTSMCINVVQEKLSDTFRQASAKLGTTIGLTVAEEAGMVPPEVLDLELNNQQY